MFEYDLKGSTTSVAGAFDTNGNFFPLDSLPQQINRDGAGNVQSIVASYKGSTWTQTYSYINGFVTNISGWVKA